jgi:hypothetical protein
MTSVIAAPRPGRPGESKAWLEGEAHPEGMKMKALLPRQAVRSLGRKKKRKGYP